MPTTSEMPLLLTAEEAAAQLKIGRTKMFTLLVEGEVESVRIGRQRRVPAEALAAYVRRLRTEQAEAETP